MHRKDSAVNHIALDKEDEAIKRFVLSPPVGANGAVLELDGRAVACVVPVVEESYFVTKQKELLPETY
jgi:hypothetical protein